MLPANRFRTVSPGCLAGNHTAIGRHAERMATCGAALELTQALEGSVVGS